jgi:hypothetical protein
MPSGRTGLDRTTVSDRALPPIPPEVLAYYTAGREVSRLDTGHGPIERARTEELLARFLPAPPARAVGRAP